MSYHDSHPVHNIGRGSGWDDELIALKREGDTILVYPGPVRLTLEQWASAVAFTTAEGENAETFKAVLQLLGAA